MFRAHPSAFSFVEKMRGWYFGPIEPVTMKQFLGRMSSFLSLLSLRPSPD